MPQENNMAELLRLMQNMIFKIDDLAADMKEVKSDVRVLKSDVKELKTNAVRVEGKLDVLSGQFRDVAGQAIKDTQRITSLEGRVDILESKSN
jgi:predicted  nucleic acid-binding Zn-ribbon protein